MNYLQILCFWLLALASGTVRTMPVSDFDVTTFKTAENDDDVTISNTDWFTTEPIPTEIPAASSELQLVPLASIASEIRMIAQHLNNPNLTGKLALKTGTGSIDPVREASGNTAVTHSYKTTTAEQGGGEESDAKDDIDDTTDDETALRARNSRIYGRRMSRMGRMDRMGHQAFRNSLAFARRRSAGYITPRKIEGFDSAPTIGVEDSYHMNHLTSESEATRDSSRIRWRFGSNRLHPPSNSLPSLNIAATKQRLRTTTTTTTTTTSTTTPEMTTTEMSSTTSTQPLTTTETTGINSITPESVYVTPETIHGSPELQNGTPETQHGTPEFQHGTPEFQHGTPEFQHGTPEFQHGTPEFQHGTPEFQHGTPEFQHGTPEFQHGTPEFQHGTPEFQHGTPEFQHGTPEFRHGTPEFQHGTPEFQHGTTESDHGTTEADVVEPVTDSGVRSEPSGKELIDWSVDATPPQNLSEEDPMGETADAHKYLVEDRTPNGYIVGEFGIVSRSSGSLRGVRYTAHGSINPDVIKEALRTFLSL